MVPIKRRCKYYDTCELADPTSVTCTQDGGGDYCGAFRKFVDLEKKEREEM